jgi:predicted transposase/invertase (TIGR01784 family)
MGFYDKWYKRFFSEPNLLKAFLENFVSETWVKDVDFSAMELTNKSFINKNDKEYHDDLVWKVKLKNRKEPLYIYLILEFQSKEDHFMALRMVNYVTSFYIDYVKTQKPAKKRELPPVLPAVIYIGKKRWKAPGNIKELIAAPYKDLAGYVPSMDYFLLDEQSIDENTLKNMNDLMSQIIKFEKSNTPHEGYNILKNFVSEVEKSPEYEKFMELFYRYFIFSQKRSNIITDAEFEKFEKLALEEAVNMWADTIEDYKNKLINQGRMEGLMEGEQLGIQKVVLTMYSSGFDLSSISKATGLSIDQITHILNSNDKN